MTAAPAIDEASCSLPLGVHAVAAARRFVEATLADWDADADTVATARLLGSELVTNAVLYGYGARQLGLQLRAGTIRLAVADDAPGRPHTRKPADDSEIGRGMQVVEACASRWGVVPDGTGKIVWCELPLDSASAATASAATVDAATLDAATLDT